MLKKPYKANSSAARLGLDKTRLGELLDLLGTIGLGGPDSQKKGILGRTYEYFLSNFATKEGKSGGEFYTPACVVKLLVAMLEPYHGRVYDPCCGSERFLKHSDPCPTCATSVGI